MSKQENMDDRKYNETAVLTAEEIQVHDGQSGIEHDKQ